MNFATTDLSDANPVASICEPGLHDFGGRARFFGQIATVRAPEDNTHVRGMLETPGDGRVLVVDGGAAKSCALLGDMLGELAVKNGWAGVIVNGYVRDSAALKKLELGVKALGTLPRKSKKGGAGEREVPVSFLGVSYAPGDWLYADEDGVLVSKTALHAR